ncbi:MAG TPA: DUF192 domain-containing protein [Zeimonas sp.]
MRATGFLAAGADGPSVRARRARRVVERLIGLVAQPLPVPGTGLWIEPCCAVHTFGVRGALDLLFVSRSGEVLRVCADVPPRRVRTALRARAVLELRAGEAGRLGLHAGMRFHWIDDPKGGER